MKTRKLKLTATVSRSSSVPDNYSVTSEAECHYIYLLLCSNGALYGGSTSDPEKRLRQHREGRGGAKFTRSFRPLGYAACWRVMGPRGNALRAEAFIKGLTRPEKDRIVEAPEGLSLLLKERRPDSDLIIEAVDISAV